MGEALREVAVNCPTPRPPISMLLLASENLDFLVLFFVWAKAFLFRNDHLRKQPCPTEHNSSAGKRRTMGTVEVLNIQTLEHRPNSNPSPRPPNFNVGVV